MECAAPGCCAGHDARAHRPADRLGRLARGPGEGAGDAARLALAARTAVAHARSRRPSRACPGLWSATPDGVVLTAAPADDLVGALGARAAARRRHGHPAPRRRQAGHARRARRPRDRGGAAHRRARAAPARPRRRSRARRSPVCPRSPSTSAGCVDAVFQPYVEPRTDHGRRGRRGAVALPDRGRRRHVQRRRAGAAPRRPRRTGRRPVAALPGRDLRREHLRGRPHPQDRRTRAPTAS